MWNIYWIYFIQLIYLSTDVDFKKKLVSDQNRHCSQKSEIGLISVTEDQKSSQFSLGELFKIWDR